MFGRPLTFLRSPNAVAAPARWSLSTATPKTHVGSSDCASPPLTHLPTASAPFPMRAEAPQPVTESKLLNLVNSSRQLTLTPPPQNNALPPSTESVWPVTQSVSSSTKNATACATSLGSPSLCIAMDSTNRACR